MKLEERQLRATTWFPKEAAEAIVFVDVLCDFAEAVERCEGNDN